MATDVDRALWGLEEAVEGVVSFVDGAAYGLRLAAKRLGDLSTGAAAQGGGPEPGGEIEELRASVQHGPDYLSDVAVLALGDHLRAFLARALGLEELPPLPDTPGGIERLAGTPGALSKVPQWVPLLLQLYRVTLRGGGLDRRALEVLGVDGLELRYAGGKVKLYTAGDRVALSEGQLEEAARALLDAARQIRLRLLTA